MLLTDSLLPNHFLDILTFEKKPLFRLNVINSEGKCNNKSNMMRKRERSFENRERFNQSVPRESLWYYSEDPVNTSSSISDDEERENEIKMGNYKKIVQQKNIQLISKAAQRNTFKRDIAFVVDWELSDIE